MLFSLQIRWRRVIASRGSGADIMGRTAAKFFAPASRTRERFSSLIPPMATAVRGEERMILPISSRPRTGSGFSLVGVGKTGPTPM